MSPSASARGAIRLAALANLAYFGIEFLVALSIGSVSLFADSIDFLEGASVNTLVLLALAWPAARRRLVGQALAGSMLVPALATLWMAWRKLSAPLPPAALPLSLTGLGALAVNLGCALLLARHRNLGGSLTKAAYLSARNDVFANVAIILSGLVTAYGFRSAWPDLIVGLGIAGLNLDGAAQVWRAAKTETGPEP
jgi:Co/Zn/Cd efflux system component